VWFTHKFRLKHMLGWVFSHNSITEIWCPTVIAIYALVKTWYKYKYKYKYIYIYGYGLCSSIPQLEFPNIYIKSIFWPWHIYFTI
jgi:hypothetical protein